MQRLRRSSSVIFAVTSCAAVKEFYVIIDSGFSLEACVILLG